MDIRKAKPGDLLILRNGHYATITRESGSTLWSPGCADSVRAVYHHPTDGGWDGATSDWDPDGAKQCPGQWPEGADVIAVADAGAIYLPVPKGRTLRVVIRRMVRIAFGLDDRLSVHTLFNGVHLIAKRSTTPGELTRYYHKHTDTAR